MNSMADPTCVYCHEPVDLRSSSTRYEVMGWEHPRQQGGTNALELRERTGRFMCSACMQRKKLFIDPRQETLL